MKKLETAEDLQERWPAMRGATLKWIYWWGEDSDGESTPLGSAKPISIAKVNPAHVVALTPGDPDQTVFCIQVHREWWGGLTPEQELGAAGFVLKQIVWSDSGNLTLERDGYTQLFNAVCSGLDLSWLSAWEKFCQKCSEIAAPKEQMSFEDVEAEAVA